VLEVLSLRSSNGGRKGEIGEKKEEERVKPFISTSLLTQTGREVGKKKRRKKLQ